jgi:DHA3 family macrolide efflux protein-like MFS transporter
VLLIGILVGLALGLLAGGRIDALVNARLRFAALLLAALALRFGTQIAIANGVTLAEQLRLPLYASAFGVLAVALWFNRDRPGLLAVAAGVIANGIAVVANGGWMPVYVPSLEAAGLSVADLSQHFHVALPTQLNLEFLVHAGPLGDIIPFPVPFLSNVGSIGDLFISTGLGWFVFATLVHGETSPKPLSVALWRGRPEVLQMDRPVVMGGGIGPGLAPPVVAVRSDEGVAAITAIPTAPAAGPLARFRAHPYVRLARDPRFSAFWTSQTISLFGDRINQIAIGVLVLARTGSPLDAGLVFFAASLPNLVLGPIAGPFVDRWDHKKVMVASDLIRAGLVLLVPLAADTNIVLVYPLVFLVTTVSLFFRPAKAAVVPRIVSDEDLVAGNAAVWTGETVADIAGYPIAGLLVGVLGTNLWLAFWLDGATYLISAGLLLAIFIPPVARQAAPRVSGAVRAFVDDLRDGWRVIRGQPTLFQNTIVSAVAQLSVGTTIALTVVYGRYALDNSVIPYPQNYAAIDAAIGVGNLVGGFTVGLIGSRLRKGRMVVVGFIAMGLGVIVLGLTQNVLVALGASFVVGVFNLVYVIPTQTLFAQLTPEGFMGRVVAFRSSLVLGAMTLSMAVSSVAAEHIPIGTVIAASGVITLAAGIVGALLPAVRDP